jgi:hypothetical protein
MVPYNDKGQIGKSWDFAIFGKKDKKFYTNIRLFKFTVYKTNILHFTAHK